MEGDPTLFAREDSIEESWRIVEPILTDYPRAVDVRPGLVGPGRRPATWSSGHGGWPGEPPA